MSTDAIEVPREHSRETDHQDTSYKHKRGDGMNGWNGTFRNILIVIISGLFTFFMTMYFNARAMEDKYVRQTDFAKFEAKMDVVYNYVVGQVAIEQQKEKDRRYNP